MVRQRSAIEWQDIVAASLVVGPDLVEADYLTIQEALDNLPPEGGSIFILPGTYALAASIALPAKPVKIVGSGQGTIIDLVAVVGPVFEIGSNHKFSFADFALKGTSGVSQFCFRALAGSGLTSVNPVTIDRVDVDGTLTRFIISGAGLNQRWIVDKCRVSLADSGTYWSGDTGTFEVSHSHFLSVGSCTIANDVTLRSVNSVFDFGPSGGANLGVDTVCEGVQFLGGDATTVFQVIPLARSKFIGCQFKSFTGSENIRLSATAVDAVVAGCLFSGATVAAVGIQSTGGRFVGNTGLKVVELGAANSNTFDGNSGFAGSTIIGPDSRVDGAKRKAVSAGATTDAFVDVFTHTNQKGLLGIGTVKNTDGADSMNVRETVIDFFGVTNSVTTVVLFGNSLLLSAQVNFATARPPYKSYTVAVQSTLAGFPASYDLQFTSQGAE